MITKAGRLNTPVGIYEVPRGAFTNGDGGTGGGSASAEPGFPGT